MNDTTRYLSAYKPINNSSKVEEASVLRQCVHSAQQEAASLLADKQELLEAMRILQVMY